MTQQGFCRITNESAETIDFDTSLITRKDMATGFVAPLIDLGLIAVSGQDAANFLHNQLTNDVEHLNESEVRLAGYCTPKGRLLATFLMWRSGDTYFLQLPREILAAIQKRLQMFVMRAKVKLLDVSDQYIVLGLGGQAAATTLDASFPALPIAPYTKLDAEPGCLIRVADAFGSACYQWITTSGNAQNIWPSLSKALKPSGPDSWHLAQIHAGVPQITLSTQEKFVPQMVNFELIGGVNFKKGCYPGQEIVARSQYLGKLKRRMLLASIDAINATPGTEVFSSTDSEQPCGMIVNAALNLQGGMDCLVELKTSVLETGNVSVGADSSVVLRFATLPYPLPPENEER